MRMILSMLRRLSMTSNCVRKTLCGIAAGCLLSAGCGAVQAQTQAACGADGYRVTGTRWDAVLRKGYEYRQDCAHPEWPARLVVLTSADGARIANSGPATSVAAAISLGPLMVNAGSPVRLWLHSDVVRIEMNGVAERSARIGDHITVQVTHQSDENGLTEEHIAGIVRGPGEVEMER
jgi:hypothetical protein